MFQTNRHLLQTRTVVSHQNLLVKLKNHDQPKPICICVNSSPTSSNSMTSCLGNSNGYGLPEVAGPGEVREEQGGRVDAVQRDRQRVQTDAHHLRPGHRRSALEEFRSLQSV